MGYWGFLLVSGFGFVEPWGFLGKVDVTYVNQTDERIQIYKDDRLALTVDAGESVSDEDYKFEWWWDRSVLAIDDNGRIAFAAELDRDDLEDMDNRIVIGEEGPSAAFNACGMAAYPDCLERQDGLTDGAAARCEEDVCFAPLGAISPELVSRLQEYFEETYGLDVGIVTPRAIPEETVDVVRHQVDTNELAKLIEPSSEGAVVIGLTPVDVYISDVPQWRWAFGMSSPQAVLSTMRMDPANWGHEDDNLLFSRLMKMTTKYIAVSYFGLATSSDPESQLYNGILSVDDLDRMSDEPLEIAGR
jgi:predicted Zn-dependent protease